MSNEQERGSSLRRTLVCANPLLHRVCVHSLASLVDHLFAHNALGRDGHVLASLLQNMSKI